MRFRCCKQCPSNSSLCINECVKQMHFKVLVLLSIGHNMIRTNLLNKIGIQDDIQLFWLPLHTCYVWTPNFIRLRNDRNEFSFPPENSFPPDRTMHIFNCNNRSMEIKPYFFLYTYVAFIIHIVIACACHYILLRMIALILQRCNVDTCQNKIVIILN